MKTNSVVLVVSESGKLQPSWFGWEMDIKSLTHVIFLIRLLAREANIFWVFFFLPSCSVMIL